jgi:predicted metal-dependent hydrolase
MKQIKLGDITIDVVQKDIKNLHLSVYPPKGRVHISAPLRMNLETIRIYSISKLEWIKKQQHKIRNQKREIPRDYLTKESHYYLGKRYMLKVIELDTVPVVNLSHETIELYVRPGSTKEKKQEVLENWYREKLRELVVELTAKWEKKMKLKVEEIGIKKMRTKWGACNKEAHRIWLNFELVKKPVECIEYVLVHELVHFKERNHNDRFISYMNLHLPHWKQLKAELNRLPVSHVDWGY